MQIGIVLSVVVMETESMAHVGDGDWFLGIGEYGERVLGDIVLNCR